AIETLDGCLARIETAARDAGALLLMTADHGNAEQLIDAATGQPHTAHTTNPVPFVICRKQEGLALRRGGTLGDVAPTLLHLQGLPVPKEMTGGDLRNC
ncbi:MAG TPA: 2,3-bisphosphoglycerate-independent phosphoglycerate mutase, partial [Thermoanaerobaculia bacterium]|nr:2,3-bisphosphoglycerate-independent phosphoglycerate mutase [Thermoanaerobaculia bacterium]